MIIVRGMIVRGDNIKVIIVVTIVSKGREGGLVE